jgi:hypothetical protein
MLRRIPKVLLLVALLAALVASSAPVFGGSHTCRCYLDNGGRNLVPPGGCHFDQTTLQCVNTGCRGSCF